MKLSISINMDNAAFQDNDTELYEMLGRVAMAVQDGEREGNLRDSNGNRVGQFKVKGENMKRYRTARKGILCDWCGNYVATIKRDNQKICQYCFGGHLMQKMDDKEYAASLRKRPWYVCKDMETGMIVTMHRDACKYWPHHDIISSHATEDSAKCKATKLLIINGVEKAFNKTSCG